MQIQPASDRSLLVSFGNEISLDAHHKVRRLLFALEPLPTGLLNLHPAFASVLIDFDPRRRTHAEVESLVRERLWDDFRSQVPESAWREALTTLGERRETPNRLAARLAGGERS